MTQDSINGTLEEGLTAMAAVSKAADVTAISAPDNKIVVLIGGIASAVGAILLVFFPPLKQKFPESQVFPVIAGLSYLLLNPAYGGLSCGSSGLACKS